MKIYLLIFIFLKPVLSDKFNTIDISVKLAESAYCVDTVNTWDCYSCEPDNSLEYVINEYGNNILLGYNDVIKSMFVSYRGSSDLENWIYNAMFQFSYPYNNYPNIGIESGFMKQFTNTHYDVFNKLSLISKKYNNKNLLITGHSLGAALASILAFEIKIIHQDIYNIYDLVTFGSPRVGNKYFSDMFIEYNIPSTRITHYYDIVPHIPQEFLSYQHIYGEIWYNEDNSNYKICQDQLAEDDTCSNSCAPYRCTSTSDHLNYLNVSMGIEGDC